MRAKLMQKILIIIFIILFTNQASAEKIWACNPWTYVQSGTQWGNVFLLKGDENGYTWVDKYGDKRILKYITDGLFFKIYVDVQVDTTRDAYYVFYSGVGNLEMRRLNWGPEQIMETGCSDQ